MGLEVADRFVAVAAGGNEAPENTERVRIAVAVSVETMQGFYAGTTGDLSYGMAFVPTDDPPRQGAEVALSISLPGGALIEADGCVQWVRRMALAQLPEQPAGCGVAWQTFDRAVAEVVQRYVLGSDYTFAAADI